MAGCVWRGLAEGGGEGGTIPTAPASAARENALDEFKIDINFHAISLQQLTELINQPHSTAAYSNQLGYGGSISAV